MKKREDRDGYIDMWNNWAKKRKGVPVYDLWLNDYEDILKNNQLTEILDLGCGNGADTLYLTERKYKVVSCDFSKEALLNIKSQIPNSKTKYLNMKEKFPFKDNSFSVIIADLSLHYFDEDTTIQIMNEIKRILNKGGFLLARVVSVENIQGINIGKELEQNFYFEGAYTKRFFNDNDLKKYFGIVGKVEFKKVEMTRNEDEYLKPRIVYQIKVEKL